MVDGSIRGRAQGAVTRHGGGGVGRHDGIGAGECERVGGGGEQLVQGDDAGTVGPNETHLRLGEPAMAGREPEDGVTVRQAVGGPDRPREAVVSRLGEPASLGAGEQGVGGDHPDRRVQRWHRSGVEERGERSPLGWARSTESVGHHPRQRGRRVDHGSGCVDHGEGGDGDGLDDRLDGGVVTMIAAVVARVIAPFVVRVIARAVTRCVVTGHRRQGDLDRGHADPTPQTAGARSGPGPDRTTRGTASSSGRGSAAERRIGSVAEVPAPAEIEDDGGRHDRDDLARFGPDRDTEPAVLEMRHHAIGRCQSVRAPSAQAQAVDHVHEVAVVERVGLPRTRPAAPDVDGRDRAVGGQDRSGPGEPAATAPLVMADEQPGDVGERAVLERVRRAGHPVDGSVRPVFGTMSSSVDASGRPSIMQKAAACARRAAGEAIHRAREAAVRWAAIGPDTPRGRRFGSFGADSVICYPPLAIMNERYVHIGDGTVFGPHVALSAGMVPGQTCPSDRVVVIGDRCLFGRGASIVGHLSIEIGDDVWTGPNVYITDQNHGYDDMSRPIAAQIQPERPVTIGDGSWLGHGTVVLPGARIGRHVVIGANSVVTGVVPDFSVAVGAPARVVKRIGDPADRPGERA